MPSPLTFFKSLNSPKKEPPIATATPSKSILRRNPAKLKKSSRRAPTDQDYPELEKVAHIPVANSPLDEHDEDNGAYEFHSSIPNGSVDGWRNFPPPHRLNSIMVKGGRPASHPRQSEALAENPIVSRYITTGQTEHPLAKIPEPIPPSRTWSTIPSVQRESSHVRRASTKNNDATTTTHPSFAPTARDQSTPFRRSKNSEDFSLPTVGQQPSEYERRYLEYPTTPSAKRANLSSYPSNASQLQIPDRSTSLRRANTQRHPGLNYRDEADSDPEVYHYIVPAGVDVIFQDEDGTEITRTGKPAGTPVRNRPLKSAPIMVHDEFGTFLYQDAGAGRSSGRNHEGTARTYSARDGGLHGTETDLPPWILSSPTSLSPRSKFIKIDPNGTQTFLIKPTTHSGRS